MNNVFFGSEGLTSTSANYYANIAQELIQAATERLNGVRFYEVSVSSLDAPNTKLMSTGNKSLDFINEDLKKVAEMNSFCAWVREAIKRKEALLVKVTNTSLNDWAKNAGIPIPEAPSYPESVAEITEENVIDSWDTNKRNKYLRLEAFASTYGKYIHPKGAFSKARKDVHAAENCPIYKEGSGRDLILYYQNPTIKVDKVDEMFISLQNTYRSYEKELNEMKAEIKKTINDTNVANEQEYQEKLFAFVEEGKEYQSVMDDIRSKFNAWKTSKREEISNLKIILPKDLLGIFNEIKKQECSK